MEGLNIQSFPKKDMVKAGNKLGFRPNKLINLSGIEDSNEIIQIREEWKPLVKTFLNPQIISGIIQVSEDDLVVSNLLADKDRVLLYGEDQEFYNIMVFSPIDMVYYLDGNMEEVEEEEKIVQSMSLNGLISLLSIVDSLKRMKLINLLDPSIGEVNLSCQLIDIEYHNSKSYGDLRWLGPIIGELRWEDKEVDFKRGVKELADIGLIDLIKDEILPNKKGQDLFRDLLRRKTVLGIRSTFYDEGQLSYLALVIIETPSFLWYIEVKEDTSLISISSDDARALIATIIAPGDLPQESQSESQVQSFCIECGFKLDQGSKFCPQCGKKLLS